MTNEITTTHEAQPVGTRADSDAALIVSFLRTKAAKSENTFKTYETALRQFMEFIGGRALASITIEDLQDYDDHLRNTYGSPYTRNLKLSAVKSLLSYGQKTGYLRLNVGAAYELPETPNTLTERVMSEADVVRLIDATKTERDMVLLTLLYYTGLRVSEATGLEWRHVNGDTLTVHGKGSKTRFVKMPRKLIDMLEGLRPDDAAGADPVFVRPRSGKALATVDVHRVIKRAGAAAGLPDVSAHWLRHAHASHALDRGASVVVVKETLGHSNISVTNKYLHARPDDSSGMYLPK